MCPGSRAHTSCSCSSTASNHCLNNSKRLRFVIKCSCSKCDFTHQLILPKHDNNEHYSSLPIFSCFVVHRVFVCACNPCNKVLCEQMPESMPSTADDSGYKHFVHLLNEDKQKSPAVACVETLYRLVCQSTGVLALITRTLLSIAHLASTVQGLTDELHVCVRAIRASDAYGTSCTSVSSAAELFMRFISLAALDQPVCVTAGCAQAQRTGFCRVSTCTSHAR
jgi:hypothetical protein